MRKNKILIGMILIFGIMLISLVSANYIRSAPQYTMPGFSFASRYTGGGFAFDEDKMCKAGEDFILQIQPLGCTPSVVRSDLLEEQNVAVFCPVSAIKLNPLIKIEAINTIRFTGEYPKDVARLGFHPAQAALGVRGDLNTPIDENIGYAVIVLRRNKNESSMPEVVKGNLTATIRYDIENAFGIGRASFNLPQSDDETWNDEYKRYTFWDGRGFLKLEGIDEDTARISIYSSESLVGGRWTGKKKIASDISLEKGQVSNEVYLPTFDYCLGGLKLKLEDIENPDTTARVKVNDDVFELVQGQKFLDERCTLSKITKQGINKEVEVRCRTDDGIEKLDLSITPKVDLDINGKLNSYEIGDFLYRGGEGKFVYLGYANTERQTGDIEDLQVYLFSFPDKKGDKLDDKELLSIKRFVSLLQKEDSAKRADIVDSGITVLKSYAAGFNFLVKKFGKGSDFRGISYSEGKDFRGSNVLVEGLSGVEKDFEDAQVNENYEKAIDDYEEVMQSYPGIKDDEETFGEKALIEEIKLSSKISKRETVKELCEDFANKYSKSSLPKECDINSVKSFSQEIYSNSIMINGEVKEVSLDNIFEPSLNEFSAEIFITNPEGETYSVILGKDEIYYLNDENTEYIQLLGLESDRAEINVKIDSQNFWKELGSAFKAETEFLDKDVAEDVGGSKYSFLLSNVNLEKNAKVSIIPNINYAKTEADFKFEIGIEKRAIDLSPQKINKKLDKLDKQIKRWEDISEGLGKSVKGLKFACLSTGIGLTAKNFVSNMNGKGVARQKVMRGKGGWYEKCEDAVATGELDGEKVNYRDADDCLIKKSKEVDEDVQAVYEIIKEQNKKMESYEEDGDYVVSSKLLQDKILDRDKITKDYSSISLSALESTRQESIGDIKVSEIKSLLSEEGYDNGNYDLDDLKSIELYSKLLEEKPDSELAKKELHAVLKDIKVNSDSFKERDTFAGKFPSGKVKPNDITWLINEKNINRLCYSGLVYSDLGKNLGKGIDPDQPVAIIRTPQLEGGKKYIVILEYTGTYFPVKTKDDAGVTKLVYDMDGKLVADPPEVFDNILFIKCDSYENSYKNPIARYYETNPYKGYPAIIPFDKEEGWYAATKAVLPFGGNIRAYDESGKVNSYWICNVGENGIEEFDQLNDDNCQMINLGTGQTYTSFSGLGNDEAKQIIDAGVQAIYDAQTQYPKLSKQTFKERKVRVKNLKGKKWEVKVGEPATSVSDIECADFMSPKECQVLFNVCDPVICPPSRCDFGGKYPVSDPIQSGIIGSLALCLPNFKAFGGEVYIPVCLTGLKAGIDGWISVKKSYKDCLQENLETGQTIGICDQIHSVYMCEFLWRQGLPLLKVGIPKMLSLALGQNVRGGGEYMSVQNAWQTAQESMNFFTQTYGSNSYKAFKARSVEEAGGTICKAYSSIAYPNAMDFLDAVTEPDSPSQFHGRFEEIPYTTATNPPVSHYKVFYHIYAGDDRGAYYSVYLEGSQTSTYFADAGYTRMVGSGYIPAGDYESQTEDFTAPAGYDKLCIVVNGQEECGFKEVSTSFAENYITDEYLNQEISKKDITSESTCISGSPSFYSLLDPSLNIQETAGDIVNPEIYNKGIIRICATDNPGIRTDPNAAGNGSRWVEVGYCDNKKIKCWLDTKSVEEVIDSPDLREFIKSGNVEGLADDSLEGLGKHYSDILFNEGGYLSDEEFETEVGKIKEKIKSMPDVQIVKIEEILEKVFYDKQKAKLLFLRGNAFGIMAINAWETSLEKQLINEKGEIINIACESPQARKVILDKAQEFVDSGKTPEELGCKSDYDGNEDVFSCYDGAKSIYIKAGYNPYGIWYDKNDLSSDNSYLKNRFSDKKDVKEYLDSKYNLFASKDVYSVLTSGDMLEIYNRNTQVSSGGHNVIFKEWEDENKRIAKVYSYPGGNSKNFQLTTYDFTRTPIKLIWAPCVERVISEKEKKLQDIINGEDLPVWENPGGCSGYVARLYTYLFDKPCSWVNAWCRHLDDYGDKVWYLFDEADRKQELEELNTEIQNTIGGVSGLEDKSKLFELRDYGIDKLAELEGSGELQSGMIVGVYYPGSQYNPGASENSDDEKKFCVGDSGKKIKVRYTHNLLYLGKKDNGQLLFAEHFGNQGIQKRTLDEFAKDDLVPVLVVSISDDVKETEEKTLLETNIESETKKLSDVEQGLEEINVLIKELEEEGSNPEVATYSSSSRLKVLIDDLIEKGVFDEVYGPLENYGILEKEYIKGTYSYQISTGLAGPTTITGTAKNILQIKKLLEDKRLGTSENIEQYTNVKTALDRLDSLIEDISNYNGQLGYRMYYNCKLDGTKNNWGCAEFKQIISKDICAQDKPLDKEWWQLFRKNYCKNIRAGDMNLIEVREAISGQQENYPGISSKDSLNNLDSAIAEIEYGFIDKELNEEISENMYLLNSLEASKIISSEEYRLLSKAGLDIEYLLTILKIKKRSESLSKCDDSEEEFTAECALAILDSDIAKEDYFDANAFVAYYHIHEVLSGDQANELQNKKVDIIRIQIQEMLL